MSHLLALSTPQVYRGVLKYSYDGIVQPQVAMYSGSLDEMCLGPVIGGVQYFFAAERDGPSPFIHRFSENDVGINQDAGGWKYLWPDGESTPSSCSYDAATDRLYVADEYKGSVQMISPVSGAPSAVSWPRIIASGGVGRGLVQTANAVAFKPTVDGGILYVGQSSSASTLIVLSGDLSGLTPATQTAIPLYGDSVSVIIGLFWDASTDELFGAGNDDGGWNLFRVDQASGNITAITSTTQYANSMTTTPGQPLFAVHYVQCRLKTNHFALFFPVLFF